MRQILMDTETTGFDPLTGDRIIEIGAVELIKRRLTGNNYHQFINPQRSIPEDAIKVHGITDERVANEPKFAEIIDDFMQFIQGAEVIIHNAPFDVGFINHELSLLKHNRWGKLEDHCRITDSLKMAAKMYPGQRNNLDALCRRLYIDNSNRTYHGALLDSEILADVYLAMTGGQTDLLLDNQYGNQVHSSSTLPTQNNQRASLKVIHANHQELDRHQQKLAEISKKVGRELNW
ncbi:DNA polymerase III subunit epsilon [Thiosulfatimonas sediminis]|uniref:DNA polymerase III subunit epsilon n=1 Tax=Thiosulfatimonas sediminis TaxID=2675054 RepID=A0A6F8PUG1_9GAMM|nr:DNA polymerase III subunit epsilon [Thiosulfatimonas sediminis]BBP45749.1 DNA polymerase III subunit epsilon [Thiosulfatimonas sediminis]